MKKEKPKPYSPKAGLAEFQARVAKLPARIQKGIAKLRGK